MWILEKSTKMSWDRQMMIQLISLTRPLPKGNQNRATWTSLVKKKKQKNIKVLLHSSVFSITVHVAACRCLHYALKKYWACFMFQSVEIRSGTKTKQRYHVCIVLEPLSLVKCKPVDQLDQRAAAGFIQEHCPDNSTKTCFLEQATGLLVIRKWGRWISRSS